MRLVKISIEGYRSIRERLEMTLDTRVTVLLGANDHGKTNLLDSLRHLNGEVGFSSDDLNWDLEEDAENFPYVRYELRLETDEAKALARIDAAERLLAAASEARNEYRESIEAFAEEKVQIEERYGELAAEVEDAAARAKERANARDGEPGNEELQKAATQARAALVALQQGQKKCEERVAEIDPEMNRLLLGEALAAARAIEAEALRLGKERELAVGDRLAAAEGLQQQRGRALKKLISKAKSADSAVAELAEDGDDATRQAAERAQKTAASELSESREQALAAEREARQLQIAADALSRREEGDALLAEVDLPLAELLEERRVPAQVAVVRRGLAGELEPEASEELGSDGLRYFLAEAMPRVEVVEPLERLPDDVSLSQLNQDSYAFMRGIFLYAGLAEREWSGVFAQDARSSMRLQKASAQLNETLKASWSQGRELDFRLQHDSKRSRITLEIMDPAVKSAFTKPSRRSSGFTHFFALKTVLHALQSESPRSSYIWIFDEPGIHLHPDGQRDLIQVMETLSETNQVIYSTHSIFLANQNYPTRHRLLQRSDGGTVLDGKPFLSRWQTALDALGLSLAGTVLFAPNVLLVEGDSDAIYITAILRKLIAVGSSEIDLNRFAAIATGDAATAAVLIRMLREGGPAGETPYLAVLVDGDGGGKQRLAAISEQLGEGEFKSHQLTQETTLEDHLPGGPALYLEAVRTYLEQMVGLEETQRAELEQSFAARFPEGKLTKGLAAWSREDAAQIASLKSPPSSVGIARAYIGLLAEASLDPKEMRRARALVEWITGVLRLPEQTLLQADILN